MHDESAIGKVLGGCYRLVRFVAQGGMGEVYEAVDQESGARVAAKLLHPQFNGDAELLERLKREAWSAERIRSPHVARVIAAGTDRDSRGWIIFEFLEGESLDARLRRDKTVPFLDVAWMIAHTLLGLEAAHNIGIAHRDIKPANLFLERAPKRLRVLDFGVAKRVQTGAGGAASALTQPSPLTRLGDVVGTPSYMSPEQLENSVDVDCRTDIYSVGLVVYRMITGNLLYERQDLRSLFELKQRGALPTLTHASGVVWHEALESWVGKAAARKRDDRYESAGAALASWYVVVDAMKNYAPLPAVPDRTHADTDLAPITVIGKSSS